MFWVLDFDRIHGLQILLFFFVQSLHRLTVCGPVDCSPLGFPVLQYLPEFAHTHAHCVGDATQPSRPLPSPSRPSRNRSQHQRLFQWVGSLHQVPKYWSFNFSISPSDEYSGLLSFKIDWFDILTVQGTLSSLLQLYSSKSICTLALSLPSLTSVHDYWKKHSFDYTDLCWQSDVSAF